MKKKKEIHILVQYRDDSVLQCVKEEDLRRQSTSKLELNEHVQFKFTDGLYYSAKVLFIGGKFL